MEGSSGSQFQKSRDEGLRAGVEGMEESTRGNGKVRRGQSLKIVGLGEWQ